MSYDTIGKKANSKNDRGSFNLHQHNPYQVSTQSHFTITQDPTDATPAIGQQQLPTVCALVQAINRATLHADR